MIHENAPDSSHWYRVTLTDNWCKPSRWHGYVKAAPHTVDRVAIDNCPDAAMCQVSMVADLPDADDEDIEEKLTSAATPNEAILEDGTVLRRSDVRPPKHN
mgnify:CR=1 FL=1